MPQEINSAPEEYQRRMHYALRGLSGVDVIADDTLVYGCGYTLHEAIKDHDANLENLLERARKVNLLFNVEKLRLRQEEVPYMGNILISNCLKIDPGKDEAVLNLQPTTDKQSTQRLLGFVNFLTQYLPSLSDISEPLRRLTGNDAIFTWQSQQKNALKQIKQLVTTAPVLRYYNAADSVTLQCDACEWGLGAVILYNGQPVAYASSTMSPSERNYAQIEKETLAIVFACERFDHYLCGQEHITVQSDHKPLEIIFKSAKTSPANVVTAASLQFECDLCPGKILVCRRFSLKSSTSCETD